MTGVADDGASGRSASFPRILIRADLALLKTCGYYRFNYSNYMCMGD